MNKKIKTIKTVSEILSLSTLIVLYFALIKKGQQLNPSENLILNIGYVLTFLFALLMLIRLGYYLLQRRQHNN